MAGYNWILSPASIFVAPYLKEFCSNFNLILLDSFSLVKILEREKFDSDCFLFTLDFEHSRKHTIDMMNELVFEFTEMLFEMLNLS